MQSSVLYNHLRLCRAYWWRIINIGFKNTSLNREEVIILAEFKAKKIIRFLKENGYVEVSINGDHHKWRNGSGHPVVAPYTSRNSTIAIGTYKAIIRQIKGNHQ